MKWHRPIIDATVVDEPSRLALTNSSNDFCACVGPEMTKDKACTACGKPKKKFKEGFTCNKGDDLVHFMAAGDNKPKQWCALNGCAIYGEDEYYACKRADVDCDYRCCSNCYRGIKLFVPGEYCN